MGARFKTEVLVSVALPLSGRPPSLARFQEGKELGMLGRQLYDYQIMYSKSQKSNDCCEWVLAFLDGLTDESDCYSSF